MLSLSSSSPGCISSNGFDEVPIVGLEAPNLLCPGKEIGTIVGHSSFSSVITTPASLHKLVINEGCVRSLSKSTSKMDC